MRATPATGGSRWLAMSVHAASIAPHGLKTLERAIDAYPPGAAFQGLAYLELGHALLAARNLTRLRSLASRIDAWVFEPALDGKASSVARERYALPRLTIDLPRWRASVDRALGQPLRAAERMLALARLDVDSTTLSATPIDGLRIRDRDRADWYEHAAHDFARAARTTASQGDAAVHDHDRERQALAAINDALAHTHRPDERARRELWRLRLRHRILDRADPWPDSPIMDDILDHLARWQHEPRALDHILELATAALQREALDDARTIYALALRRRRCAGARSQRRHVPRRPPCRHPHRHRHATTSTKPYAGSTSSSPVAPNPTLSSTHSASTAARA